MSLRDREEDRASVDDDDDFDTKSQVSRILGYVPTAPMPDFDNVKSQIDNDNRRWQPAKVRRRKELELEKLEQRDWNKAVASESNTTLKAIFLVITPFSFGRSETRERRRSLGFHTRPAFRAQIRIAVDVDKQKFHL